MNWLTLDSREKDALVAERVFGAKVKVLNEKSGWRRDLEANIESLNDPIMTDWGIDCYVLKQFSSNIQAAMMVLDKYADSQIRISNKAMNSEYWWVTIDGITAQGSTLPDAIAAAALMKEGVDIWEKTSS